MSELKNCPFCGRTKFIFRYDEKYGNIVSCTFCGGSISSHISREDAIKRWNTRTESEARVLTLEELTNRVGKPVYILDDDEPKNNGWVIWTDEHVEYWLDIPGNGECCGTIWRAYDREPKGE